MKTKKNIMTIIALAVVIMAAVLLTGCNKSYGFGNYDFEKIHVDTYHYSKCFNVDKWYESENGIEVKTREAGYMWLAEGMYILVEDDCPFCE